MKRKRGNGKTNPSSRAAVPGCSSADHYPFLQTHLFFVCVVVACIVVRTVVLYCIVVVFVVFLCCCSCYGLEKCGCSGEEKFFYVVTACWVVMVRV